MVNPDPETSGGRHAKATKLAAVVKLVDMPS